MKHNLTTLGSTHHFLQGAAQVSAACQPFPCLGLRCPFVEYKGSSWKFFLGTRSSSCAPPHPLRPRLGFVFVRCPATGSIPFPFLLSHEEQVVSLSGSPSLWGSSEFRADIASHCSKGTVSLFSLLHLFLYSASISFSCNSHWGQLWLLFLVFSWF